MLQERGRGAVLVGVAQVDAALEHPPPCAFRCGCSPNQPWTNNWTKLPSRLEPSMRTVNVHEAKTHFSRLIDAAHAGETILVAKDGKPWARLVPLENDRPRRQPGLLRGQVQLPCIDVLLAPLPPEELDATSDPLLS
jgi:prevent-host-death family protein